LKEEITPKFEKLRKEKALYLDFQKTEAEIERIKKLVVAFEHTTNQVPPFFIFFCFFFAFFLAWTKFSLVVFVLLGQVEQLRV